MAKKENGRIIYKSYEEYVYKMFPDIKVNESIEPYKVCDSKVSLKITPQILSCKK